MRRLSLAILLVAVAGLIWVLVPASAAQGEEAPRQTVGGGRAPAAEASGGQAPAARPAQAKPNTVTERCADAGCHAALVEHKVMHGPAAQLKCLACHEYEEPRDHSFKLASEANRLCMDCHTIKHRTVVHAPVKDGHCTGCHDPHGSAHRAMLVNDPAQGLCLDCHSQDFSKKKFVHGPVATGACILCHEPHSSWQEKLLVEAPQKLCLGCHSELVPKNEQARHVHDPVKEDCSACHDAHASDIKHQLRSPAPELCLTCHTDVKKTLAASAVVHGAMTHAGAEGQGGGCSSCHAPHFSKLPKLQRTTQPESCLSNCHDRPVPTADGRTLADMSALLKHNDQHHGPIREGACTACHQPHAGERFGLLSAAYPPEFYSPFKLDQYALCFNCHIPDLVLKPKGEGLTRFRDGERNLHYLHVNQEKGRTCRACHEVHASKRPFHIRESVPFGERGWLLEINYEQTDTGGTCTPGCHVAQTYDRGGESPQRQAGGGVTHRESSHAKSGE